MRSHVHNESVNWCARNGRFTTGSEFTFSFFLFSNSSAPSDEGLRGRSIYRSHTVRPHNHDENYSDHQSGIALHFFPCWPCGGAKMVRVGVGRWPNTAFDSFPWWSCPRRWLPAVRQQFQSFAQRPTKKPHQLKWRFLNIVTRARGWGGHATGSEFVGRPRYEFRPCVFRPLCACRLFFSSRISTVDRSKWSSLEMVGIGPHLFFVPATPW